MFHADFSEGNGASGQGGPGGGAGILMATAVPGGIVSGNVVADNTVAGNSLGGITLHTHVPGSTVANNVIINNTINTNMDVELGPQTAGIDINAAGSPITGTIVSGNTITGNHYGIFASPWMTLGTQVAGNTFSNDAYMNPGWVPYGIFSHVAGMPNGFLGSSWVGAQQDAQALLKAGVTTDAAYLTLVHSKAGALGAADLPLQHDAENLYNQYHIYQ